MADTSSSSNLRITRLILVPALITLAVTLLRLTGELMHWSSILFSRAEGGGAAIVGISWLPLIFGPYFAVKLYDQNEKPSGFGKTIGFALLGFVILIVGAMLGFGLAAYFPGQRVLGLLVMAAAAALQFVPWKALAKTLIAYGYAARIPVAIVMFFAMSGSWGTHYDAVPPQTAQLAFWPKYLYLAIAPQLVMWIGYTMTLGALFGAIYVAIVRRKKAATAPASQQAAGA
jgi:hypothetical protein